MLRLLGIDRQALCEGSSKIMQKIAIKLEWSFSLYTCFHLETELAEKRNIGHCTKSTFQVVQSSYDPQELTDSTNMPTAQPPVNSKNFLRQVGSYPNTVTTSLNSSSRSRLGDRHYPIKHSFPVPQICTSW